MMFSEWLTHQHRDTLASIVGHPPLLAYLSVADGECQARERFEVTEVSRPSYFHKDCITKSDRKCYNPAGNRQERRRSSPAGVRF